MIPNGKNLRATKQRATTSDLCCGSSTRTANSAALTLPAPASDSATASAVVSELMEQGLVGDRPGPVGWRQAADLLQVPPSARHLIGLDLARHSAGGAVFNLRGQAVPSRQRGSGWPGRSQDFAATVLDLLDRLVVETNQPLLGIGVGARRDRQPVGCRLPCAEPGMAAAPWATSCTSAINARLPRQR